MNDKNKLDRLEKAVLQLRADLNIANITIVALAAALPIPVVALAAFHGLAEQAEADALASPAEEGWLSLLSESRNRMESRFHHALELFDESQSHGNNHQQQSTDSAG